MLVESLEGANEDAAVLQDASHPVVDVLQHLAALAHGLQGQSAGECGSPGPRFPTAQQPRPSFPHGHPPSSADSQLWQLATALPQEFSHTTSAHNCDSPSLKILFFILQLPVSVLCQFQV